MALHNPSSLYTGGAVTFNSNPSTQFYLQSQARKRAKDEALDNYFQNVSKSINPAGMRTQDIEGGWMQEVNNWRDFYQANKDAIKNPALDNGRSYNEYMSGYQNIINNTEKSKNAAGATGKLLPVFTDPTRRRLIPEGVIGEIGLHEKSIYDPQHKQFKIEELDFNAKPFDIPAQQKYIGGLTKGFQMGELITNIKTDPKTHSTTTTYHSTYNPDTLAALALRNASAYRNDTSFNDFIDQLSEDDNAIMELNPKFKAAYGRDLQSHEDIATAWALNSIQTEKDKQKLSSFNPFLGQSSSGANSQANKFNYGVEMTNALRTNDADKISNLVNLLRSGKGNVVVYDAFPRKENGVDYIYLQLRDKDAYGEGDVYTKKYAINDSGLPNILTKLYQDAMGADATQEKLQYPTQQNEVVTPVQKEYKPKPQTKAPAKKQIKKSDIATKAANAGYSVEEYQKLLKQNGVQIID